MSKVTLSTQLPASANSVWKLIGGFNALPDWHPAIAKSELSDDGSERTLHLVGGGTIVERLETVGDERTYSYSVLKSPLPVRDYLATIGVRPNVDGTGCTVEWSGDFRAADVPDNEAVRVIQGIYQVGLDNLSRIFGI
ncbi:MAG: SRPBCC family protein [Chromatiaceae bacterium]|jgi:hypothetical protein|nr:SRPBCC family protein [Chromatiaceae bacterium]